MASLLDAAERQLQTPAGNPDTGCLLGQILPDVISRQYVPTPLHLSKEECNSVGILPIL